MTSATPPDPDSPDAAKDAPPGAAHDDSPDGALLALPPLPTPPPPPPAPCQNCGQPVPGKYCAECGQPAGVHVLTLHDVAHDVVHSALHLDSRVWRTLRTLVLKPGELTNEFIRGRRQRYLPPFRLYLILSVLFFALSALLPEGQLVHVDASGDTVIAYGPAAPDDGRPPADLSKPECNLQLDGALGERLNPALNEACAKVVADNGRHLAQVFLRNAPKLMFLFLPLMAAVAMLFYWKPRRLYAEHLVMFLHVHAFLFLTLSATAVINALMTLELPGIGLLGLVTFALILYLPWYVVRAMRVVYGDGRLRTDVKFAVMSVIYFSLLGVTMLGGLLYSAISL
jgi:hypothetical protein